MHDPRPTTPSKHVPFKQEGWGVALFIIFLALASAGTAFYIHKRTYLPPTDVRARPIGEGSIH